MQKSTRSMEHSSDYDRALKEIGTPYAKLLCSSQRHQPQFLSAAPNFMSSHPSKLYTCPMLLKLGNCGGEHATLFFILPFYPFIIRYLK